MIVSPIEDESGPAFKLIAETEFEKQILGLYGGNWFTAVHNGRGELEVARRNPKEEIADG